MIVLLGYMGSGKSTIGKILAKTLGKTFVDFDDYIEEKEGKKISNIFKDRGEIYFRKKESEYLSSLLAEHEDSVIALGGGTPCYGNNMSVITNNTVKSFYLSLNVLNLANRLFQEKEHRPVIAHLDKEQLLEFIGKHLFERNAFYQRAAHTVVVSSQTPEEVAQEIMSLL